MQITYIFEQKKVSGSYNSKISGLHLSLHDTIFARVTLTHRYLSARVSRAMTLKLIDIFAHDTLGYDLCAQIFFLFYFYIIGNSGGSRIFYGVGDSPSL